MSIFQTYLSLGFHHISNLQSYDHILFIITLCAVYFFRHWKKVLILVTAFTIGHSLTLALATLNVIHVNSGFIEFLIPLTIFITALGNLFQKNEKFSSSLHLFKYFAALFFGLIHGLGFSNYLRSLLSNENDMLTPLFAFNVGVELGQILIVLGFLSFAFLMVRFFRVKYREWNLVVSGAGIGVSIVLMIERWPF